MSSQRGRERAASHAHQFRVACQEGRRAENLGSPTRYAPTGEARCLKSQSFAGASVKMGLPALFRVKFYAHVVYYQHVTGHSYSICNGLRNSQIARLTRVRDVIRDHRLVWGIRRRRELGANEGDFPDTFPPKSAQKFNSEVTIYSLHIRLSIEAEPQFCLK